jgi:tRNA-Thr(GGU) m(6)t(6)A37 methyltransferase TsaA
MTILLDPVATVKNNRTAATDDFWGNVVSEIGLLDHIPTEAFDNIELFSHLEVIYYFDRVDKAKIIHAGRPRGNPDYPIMGIFSQRKKDRPNQLGLCTVELVEHNGRSIKVKYLDAIDNTPVLDIKPVFKEFESKTEIRQAAWVNDLMKNYWK